MLPSANKTHMQISVTGWIFSQRFYPSVWDESNWLRNKLGWVYWWEMLEIEWIQDRMDDLRGRGDPGITTAREMRSANMGLEAVQRTRTSLDTLFSAQQPCPQSNLNTEAELQATLCDSILRPSACQNTYRKCWGTKARMLAKEQDLNCRQSSADEF